MATLIEMTKRDTPPELVNKKVISVQPNGMGYNVKLACGHTSWWVIAPAVGLAQPCSQCLDALVEHLRKERAGGKS